MDELNIALGELEAALSEARRCAIKAAQLMRPMGGTISRCGAGQLNAYTIPTIRDFIHSPSQPGSMKCLWDIVDKYQPQENVTA